MEEQRRYYWHQISNASSSNNNVTATDVAEASISIAPAPLLSTETCAFIHGSILLALFFGAMMR